MTSAPIPGTPTSIPRPLDVICGVTDALCTDVEQNDAAVKIQSAFRRFQGKVGSLEKMTAAAVKMQSVWRGVQGRRDCKDKRQRMNAAIQLQSFLRGSQTRGAWPGKRNELQTERQLRYMADVLKKIQERGPSARSTGSNRHMILVDVISWGDGVFGNCVQVPPQETEEALNVSSTAEHVSITVGAEASASSAVIPVKSPQKGYLEIFGDHYLDVDDMVLVLRQLPSWLQGPFVILSFASAGVGAVRLCWTFCFPKRRPDVSKRSQHGCVRTLGLLAKSTNHGAIWCSLVGMGYTGVQLFWYSSLSFLDVPVPTAVPGESLTTNVISLISVASIEVSAVASIILEVIALLKLLCAGTSTDGAGRAVVYIFSMAFFCWALLGPTLMEPENSSDPILAFVGILQRWVMLVYMARTGGSLHEKMDDFGGNADVLRLLLPVTDE